MTTSLQTPRSFCRPRLTYKQQIIAVLAGFTLFLISIGSLKAQNPLNLQVQFDSSLRALLDWTPHTDPSLYTVESIDNITHVWKPVPPVGQWPIEGTSFLDLRASFLPQQRFYRVTAIPLPKPERARLVSFEKDSTLSIDEVENWLGQLGISAITPRSGVSLYSVRYETIDAFGKSVIASGGIVTPTDFDETLPLFSYQHSTVLNAEIVPSRFSFSSFESLLPLFIASQGYVTSAPDFIGLGDSPGLHPFLHATTAVSSVIDMLPVAREIAALENLETSNELYLMGYGEGGYATMATHRDLEGMNAPPYEVIASVPMAGPHDLSGLLLDTLLQADTNYPQPFILPYLLVAYNDIYAFYDDPLDVFTAEIVTRVLPSLNGRSTGELINTILPSETPREFLQPAFLESLLGDSNHPLLVALRENDVYDWKPSASLRMYHCDADETFPKAISERALDAFFDNGSNSTELIDPIPILNHEECDAISFTSAILWIETQRN